MNLVGNIPENRGFLSNAAKIILEVAQIKNTLSRPRVLLCLPSFILTWWNLTPLTF